MKYIVIEVRSLQGVGHDIMAARELAAGIVDVSVAPVLNEDETRGDVYEDFGQVLYEGVGHDIMAARELAAGNVDVSVAPILNEEETRHDDDFYEDYGQLLYEDAEQDIWVQDDEDGTFYHEDYDSEDCDLGQELYEEAERAEIASFLCKDGPDVDRLTVDEPFWPHFWRLEDVYAFSGASHAARIVGLAAVCLTLDAIGTEDEN